MARIGFVGLGNMGLPMAVNLCRAGHEVVGFDLSGAAMAGLEAAGGRLAADAPGVAAGADMLITMLPASRHVREVWLGGLAAAARAIALSQSCSLVRSSSPRSRATFSPLFGSPPCGLSSSISLPVPPPLPPLPSRSNSS